MGGTTRTITSVLLLPIALFHVGYVGAERIWYRQIWWGSRLRVGEVWSLAWSFFGRYLVLGLMIAPVIIPAIVLVAVRVVTQINFDSMENGTLGSDPQSFNDVIFDPLVFGILAASYIAMDFLLTFATPALAYTTASPREALRINRRVIREHRPASLLYVLIPSFALVLALRTGFTNIAVGVVVTAFNLLMKGATASFYLRRYGEPAERDGTFIADTPR